MRHRANLPIPFGWFVLAKAADLAPGDVRPLFFFGEHLVLFRTEDGDAHVTGAFCPHLGAHLGHGGKVEGNALVCPFHGWRFDGSGTCVGVPYARAMPPRATAGACLWSYPVLERNRMIWAWYHPRKVPPLFDLDLVAELDDPDWSEPDYYEWEVDTPIQEAGENAVDVAHFITVHDATELPKAKITLVGHRRDTQFTCPAPAINADGTIDLTRTEPFELVTRNCGPGMSTQSFEHGARAVMLGTVTPITAQRMMLRFAFTKPANVTPQQDMLTNGLIAEIVRQVEQDIPIWEHKTYREQPMLCDGDGPIAKYRGWFRQFYDDGEGSDSATTEGTPASDREHAQPRRSAAWATRVTTSLAPADRALRSLSRRIAFAARPEASAWTSRARDLGQRAVDIILGDSGLRWRREPARAQRRNCP